MGQDCPHGSQNSFMGDEESLDVSVALHSSDLLTKSYFLVFIFVVVVVVQSLNHVQLLATPWTAACQAPLSSTISQSLLKFMSTEVVMLLNHVYSAALFSFGLQSFPASGSFQMSLFFASGNQSIGASASASVLPVNILG